MLRVEMDGYRRVSKTVARRLHGAGERVYLQACKFVPDSMMFPAHEVADPARMRAEGWSFDEYVREYEFYNCCYWETGYYASYYVRSGGGERNV